MATSHTSSTTVNALNLIFTVLAVCAVGLRFYTQRVTRRESNVSDYMLVIGTIATVSVTVVGYLMVYIGGAGKHVTELTETEMENVLKLFIAAPILWGVATTAIKLSILAFYYIVFRNRQLWIAVYCTAAATICLFIITFVEPLVQCRPFRYTWDKYHTTGTCVNMQPLLIAIAALNLAIDLTIFCLPLPTLWRLQMNLRKKLELSVIFLLGLIVCVMSGIRIKALIQLDQNDFTFTVLDDCLYGLLEISLGIINACLPFLRPLASSARLGSRTGGSQSKGQLLSDEPPRARKQQQLLSGASTDTVSLHKVAGNSGCATHISLGPEDTGTGERVGGGKRIMVNRSVSMSIQTGSQTEVSELV
ncbi:hypothetical protein ASPACDRAFT_116530 [Aspergillus aculeatus ATCC 16872]|uniref:Rhodopsin domain-containing protein n=1 Tax=Aspergillus aculeatus (strain ATCC 16872 / CBS 172.66 / WB 5094) TaxID=690307 RepID=A0A1L9WZU1_ASPA1|nr:uncharacterized protein ASPACDRAFT_116530 [Aspergillus aculeatus ATCC 16872]OJK01626.1 hypothetical protein ASPACDRAFT_116530 [Aspergillus aculeatus ATCC 16872]